jgi:hypothetical protein
MKKYVYTLALYSLCLPTVHKAMELSRVVSKSVIAQRTVTKKLITQEDYRSLRDEVRTAWRPIDIKRTALADAKREKHAQKGDLPFSPFLTQPQEISVPSRAETLQKERNSALQKDVEQKWLPIEEKLLSIIHAEREKLSQELDNIIPAFRHSLQELPPLLSNEEAKACVQEIQEFSELLTQAHAEQTIPEDEGDSFQTGATLTAFTAAVLGYQQASTSETRSPFAVIGTGLALLDSSKKAVVTAAGISIVYLGIKSAVNSFNRWLHSDCEKEKEIQANTYIQKLTELEKKIDAHNAEVLRIAEQARQNAFDTLLKQDLLEKRTKEDQEKMCKQIYKDIEKEKRHKNDGTQHILNSFKKQLESIQNTVKNVVKNGQATDYAAAIALFSNKLQKLGTTVDQMAPSHSRRSSLAPSDTGTYTSRAPSQQSSRPASPANSIYSTRSEAVPRPRPLSAFNFDQRIEDFLQDISEEHSSEKHSSSENSEIEPNRIRIMPPTPPKQGDTISQDQATSSSEQPSLSPPQASTMPSAQKPLSPHRRRSFCTALFGKKEPKDTHDPRV